MGHSHRIASPDPQIDVDPARNRIDEHRYQFNGGVPETGIVQGYGDLVQISRQYSFGIRPGRRVHPVNDWRGHNIGIHADGTEKELCDQ